MDEINKLLFAEIFEFKIIQTDPNYANFLFDKERNKIILLDFGATQKIEADVSEGFRALLQATWQDHRSDIENALYSLKVLHTSFPPHLKEIFIELFLNVTKPIRQKELYVFRKIKIVEKIQEHMQDLISYQKTVRIPDLDVLFIQRKIGGLYFLARNLNAEIDLNEILKDHL